ncbi:hypothetical protein V22_10570 [Calycomorphotria hydatis]|uniref:Uncharacterized protein n=1 Tax=Calycomorphotria hydatis TaxID=2528027 RepID=A0A517T622_9PLAN|nr:hypothetical protein V22_10570 [Calycomorphotria hydatis]
MFPTLPVAAVGETGIAPLADLRIHRNGQEWHIVAKGSLELVNYTTISAIEQPFVSRVVE